MVFRGKWFTWMLKVVLRKLRCLQKVDNKKVTLKQQVNLNKDPYSSHKNHCESE